MTSTHADSLEAEIREADRRLAELRERAGLLLLQEQSTQELDDEIAQLENRSDRLRDALGSLSKRERSDEERQAQEIGNRLRGELLQLEGERLAAISRAEASLRDFVDAINGLFTISRAMVSVCQRARIPAPGQLGEPATGSRIAMLMGAVLSGIKRHPRRMGGVSWLPVYRTPSDDWRQLEQREMAASLDAITKPSTPPEKEHDDHGQQISTRQEA